MHTFSMSQVESLTGIKSHTLRIWERRYSFLKPQRTQTNIRYYSNDELRRLLNIAILINNGYKISKIDKLSEYELHSIIIELNSYSSAKFDDDINRLSLCMIEMNEEIFSAIFQRHVTRHGLLSTVMNLIYPFLAHVGITWIAHQTIPAQEHFISNLIRQKIVSAIDMIPLVKVDAKSIIMFLPENESHEIALLLANYIAKDLGFKVMYLGQNVPVEDIVDVDKIVKADLFLTMFVTPIGNKFKSFFEDVLGNFDTPLFVAGNYDVSESPDNFKHITSPEILFEELKKLRDS
jgi:DNA-binding transcriptional MerR regulator